MWLLSDSQKLPAGNLLFWVHFRYLITDFGAFSSFFEVICILVNFLSWFWQTP